MVLLCMYRLVYTTFADDPSWFSDEADAFSALIWPIAKAFSRLEEKSASPALFHEHYNQTGSLSDAANNKDQPISSLQTSQELCPGEN